MLIVGTNQIHGSTQKFIKFGIARPFCMTTVYFSIEPNLKTYTKVTSLLSPGKMWYVTYVFW